MQQEEWEGKNFLEWVLFCRWITSKRKSDILWCNLISKQTLSEIIMNSNADAFLNRRIVLGHCAHSRTVPLRPNVSYPKDRDCWCCQHLVNCV